MPTSFTTRRSQRGFVLLMLMLFVAVLAITAAAVAPSIAFRIRRDREEEMIHRGVQYSRAIRRYVKKFGRYPMRIEELENTSNLRFLRKRYKDPITGEDFKLLHLGEVQMTFGPGIAGATSAGINPVSGTSGLGGAASQGFTAGRGAFAAAGSQPGMASQGTPDQGSSGQDASQGDTGTQPKSSPDQGTPEDSDKLSTKVFGGGPIVGVVSKSKAESIREFNHKNHYNQWQFIYDPSTDRGGLLSTPNQPPLKGAVQNPQPGTQAGQGAGPAMQAPPAQGQPTPQPPPEQQ